MNHKPVLNPEYLEHNCCRCHRNHLIRMRNPVEMLLPHVPPAHALPAHVPPVRLPHESVLQFRLMPALHQQCFVQSLLYTLPYRQLTDSKTEYKQLSHQVTPEVQTAGPLTQLSMSEYGQLLLPAVSQELQSVFSFPEDSEEGYCHNQISWKYTLCCLRKKLYPLLQIKYQDSLYHLFHT